MISNNISFQYCPNRLVTEAPSWLCDNRRNIAQGFYTITVHSMHMVCRHLLAVDEFVQHRKFGTLTTLKQVDILISKNQALQIYHV